MKKTRLKKTTTTDVTVIKDTFKKQLNTIVAYFFQLNFLFRSVLDYLLRNYQCDKEIDIKMKKAENLYSFQKI